MSAETEGIAKQLQNRLDSSHHQRALLEESGIARQVVLERGYRTVRSKAELASLGFHKAQQLVPALLIPTYSPTGKVVTHQI